ncbi:hypothetical protein HDU97_007925 [Phlyctochytrium planicorne]|nr:hypothetical protein HDU97_007925 [Phlyctochytrium planicorne]
MDQTVIDGSLLEGGGQILRNSVAYSVLLSKPILIHSVRANRSNPGLRPQHLSGLKLMSTIASSCTPACLLGTSSRPQSGKPVKMKKGSSSKKASEPPTAASSTGTLSKADDLAAHLPNLSPANVGHNIIQFLPGEWNRMSGIIEAEKLEYLADTTTAGSIGLLIQVSLPVLIFSSNRSRVVMKGGTNAENAPQIDFTTDVLLPFLNRYVFREFQNTVTFSIPRRGYYPQGGGEVHMEIVPIPAGKKLSSFDVGDRGVPIRIGGRAFVAGNLPSHIAETIRKAIVDGLKGAFPAEVINRGRDIEVVKDPPGTSIGTAFGCQIWVETSTGCRITGSALASKKSRAEDVGAEAAEVLMAQWEGGGCCDEYLQDQILIFMALAEGTSRILSGPISLHSQSAMHIAKELTGVEFRTTPLNDGTPRVWIEVEGIGYSRK